MGELIMNDISILDILNRDPERMKAIGARLTKIRQDLGKTIPEFALILKVDEEIISGIENGGEFPGLEILYFLHNLFDIDLDWLVTGLHSIFNNTDDPGAKMRAEDFLKQKSEIEKQKEELFILMQIPRVEELIFNKVKELKFIFKDEISTPIGYDL
jgi:transcriptional regulator with XRE-family HTH domain